MGLRATWTLVGVVPRPQVALPFGRAGILCVAQIDKYGATRSPPSSLAAAEGGVAAAVLPLLLLPLPPWRLARVSTLAPEG